jgi:hypothetical protein
MSPIPSTSFSASYDSTTKLISAAVAVLFLVLTAAIHNVAVGCLAALVLAGSYAWSPRSYSISQRSILVKRLIAAVRIPLDGIREARIATADDFRDCIRTFGNGGLFGYSGLFRTSKLGSSTWYVTNRSHSVVVITSSKTAVFSPDDVDGFLAAIRASAPVPVTGAGALPVDSTAVYRTGSLAGILIGVAIGVIALAVVAFAIAYSPGPPLYTLTADSLTIHDRFYPVTLRATSVDVEHIRLVDCRADADWRPTARTNGFANGHYRSGWFRLASGKTVRLYRADGTRLVLLPPKGDGAAVLLETTDPEKFMREVRQRWSNRS